MTAPANVRRQVRTLLKAKGCRAARARRMVAPIILQMNVRNRGKRRP